MGSSSRTKFVSSALWVECDSKYRGGIMVVGGTLATLYIFGTYIVFWVWLRPQRSATAIHALANVYRPSSAWWEVVQFTRRLLIAAAMSFAPLNTAAAFSFILVAALSLHTWRKPFKRTIDNLAESLSLVLLLSTFIVGVIASNQALVASGGWISGISWTMFGVNAAYLIVLGAVYIKETAPKVARRVKKIKDNVLSPLLKRDSASVDD